MTLTALSLVAVLMAPPVPLSGHVEALAGANTLDARFTVTTLGGSTDTVTVQLQKPNMARIESRGRLIVADGTTVTVFNKSEKEFVKYPQTEEKLLESFVSAQLQLFRPFFDTAALDKVATARAAGSVNRSGRTLDRVNVNVDAAGNLALELYLDQGDKVVRQAVAVDKSSGSPVTTTMNVSALTLGGTLASSAFAFNAPAGAKELKPEDLVAGKWYTNLDEAKKLAKANDKLTLIWFTATWCGPCQHMKATVFPTSQFQGAAKDFILAEVDVDLQPAVARQYGVNAMPTLVFLNSEGEEVHRFVGGRPLDAFMAEMRTAKSKG